MQRFNRAKWMSCLWLAGCAGGLIWHTVWPHPEDAPVYGQLMEGEQARAASKKVLTTRPAYQVRHGVRKDIWTVSNAERLHVSLVSARSVLTIVQKKKRFEATEELEGIDCWMQEGFEGDMQRIRHVTSERGVYFFPAHRFEAETVQLALFRLPGHELSIEDLSCEIPYFTGTASQVSFVVARHVPTFTAAHLRAQFTPE